MRLLRKMQSRPSAVTAMLAVFLLSMTLSSVVVFRITHAANGDVTSQTMTNGGSWHGDVRHLPQLRPPIDSDKRPDVPEPSLTSSTGTDAAAQTGGFNAPTPGPGGGGDNYAGNYAGLDFANWGAGHPPDTNGDVGPEYYIQTVNTSIGMFRKSDGARVAAFTYNTFMSQVTWPSGNLCPTQNFGDPVVVYDSFNDRWIITDFAFTLAANGNVNLPYQQCFAVSKSGDPVSGGWNFYSVNVTDRFGDYPKFGVWNNGVINGLYMTANMFNAAGTSFFNIRMWAMNLAQMEAGAASPNFLVANLPSDSGNAFTGLPGMSHTYTGAPPSGRDEFISAIWNNKTAKEWTFHTTDFLSGTLSSEHDVTLATWGVAPSTVASPANALDTLREELQVQSQYVNLGGTEAIWLTHTVANPSSSSLSAVRWYQLNVTGGTVVTSGPLQQSTWSPDSNTSRFSPSLAVDKLNDMAIGYSRTSSTLNPQIDWAGRLSTDPTSTLGQTETLVQTGGGSQSGNCGTSACTRWGDYSGMTIDPNGCDFFYTQEYYATTGLNWQTRIASFRLNPNCTPTLFNTTLTTNPAGGVYGGTASPLQATLKRGTVALVGKTITFKLNGTTVGTGTTDSTGTATLLNASLSGINAGNYPTGVGASFAGDSIYNSSSATNVLTVGMASQTITFPPIPTHTFGDADFAPGASASSGLSVSYSATGNCSIVSGNVHITGAGSCTVTASQAGNANYNAAANVSQGFTINQASQSITFDPITGKTYGDPDFGINPTASSNLPVGVSSADQCTLDSATAPANVHITGAGDCSITATQGGNANYSAASPVNRSFDIAKKNQTITFGALGDKTYGDADFTVSATADSGLAVSFSASGPCTVTGNTVHITGAGSCTVTASQPGDSNYNPAPDVPQSFDIAKANQTISFGALGDKTYGDADFAVSASADSGLPVSFSAGATDQCTVSGNTVHLTGAGSCTVTASQPGDSNYNPAPDVPQSFDIAKANQTISFGALGDKTYGDADFAVSATASSGDAVSFSVGAGSTCDVTGNTVHINGAGSCTIIASQPGDDNYNAAPDVPQAFTINPAAATLAFDAASLSQTYDGTPKAATVTVTANPPTTGPVTITYNGDSDAPTNAGDYTVVAHLDNPNYQASDITDTLHIAKAQATLTLGTLSFTYDGTPKAVSVSTSPANLDVVTVTYDGSGTAPTNAGDYNVVAHLDNANYQADDITDTLHIAKADQTIDFTPVDNHTYGDLPFTLSATATSGLDVTFSASGGCSTTTDGTVTINSATPCTLTASQAGNANYNAAPDVPQTINIAKDDQAITFDALGDTTYGASDFAINPTASSGLTVSVAATGACTLNSTTAPANVHVTGAGTCTITASQGGDGNYNAADNVVRSFNSAKANQTISFGALSDTSYGAPDFTVSATASSGDAVSFAASGNCTVSGNTVHITGAGTCTVTASQPGDSNYNPAPDVPQTFNISKAGQMIVFGSIANHTFGDPDFTVSAYATSGDPVSFSASGSCTISGATVHITAAGSCTITASQPGDSNYSAATSVQQSFTITGYGFSNFLQPITNTAHQVGVTPSGPVGSFKAGSTVPVKFQLTNANGAIIQAASAPIWATPVSCGSTTAPLNPSNCGALSFTSNTFRWDATGQQYIYTWNTSSTQVGTYWRIGVQLADGTTDYAYIAFTK